MTLSDVLVIKRANHVHPEEKLYINSREYKGWKQLNSTQPKLGTWHWQRPDKHTRCGTFGFLFPGGGASRNKNADSLYSSASGHCHPWLSLFATAMPVSNKHCVTCKRCRSGGTHLTFNKTIWCKAQWITFFPSVCASARLLAPAKLRTTQEILGAHLTRVFDDRDSIFG